jgi:hypothetical protein
MGEVRSKRGFGVLRQVILAAMGLTPLVVGCSDSDGPKTLPFECVGPEPNESSGLVFCQTGEFHRVEAKACDASLYDPEAGVQRGTSSGATCQKNGDCTEHPWGLCAAVEQMAVQECIYGCLSDDDCGAGQTCLCTGGGPSTCVDATCKTDADCPDGTPCLLLEKDDGSPCRTYQVLRCGAECADNSDCPSGTQCSMSACVTTGVCGRPFLVGGAARLASAALHGDWCGIAAPEIQGFSLEVRDALAAHWTEVGLMEHASVAAFARFTLQLLAAGAPSSLVAEATTAMEDETEHARLCFAIASAYAGKKIGPGPLPIEDALKDQGFVEVVRTAFLEACVGETCAALEAAEASEYATDPIIAASLRRIAADESRHAELGWKFVSWALGVVDARTRALLLHEFRGLVAVTDGAVPSDGERDLTAHGVLSAASRAALRRAALAEVVSPCLAALTRSAHPPLGAPRGTVGVRASAVPRQGIAG